MYTEYYRYVIAVFCANITFYCSKNGIWSVDVIPACFITAQEVLSYWLIRQVSWNKDKQGFAQRCKILSLAKHQLYVTWSTCLIPALFSHLDVLPDLDRGNRNPWSTCLTFRWSFPKLTRNQWGVRPYLLSGSWLAVLLRGGTDQCTDEGMTLKAAYGALSRIPGSYLCQSVILDSSFHEL